MYGFLLSSFSSHARCCRISSGSCLTVHVDAIVSCLSLVEVCSTFCSLDWVVMGYLLLLVMVMLIGYNRVCSCCNSGAIGDEMHLVFECAALAHFCPCAFAAAACPH